MKLLTISVAAYNVEKYIAQVLDSLCCKSISELEIFVVDDGGKDSTMEIVETYRKKFPGSIIPVHKQNGGWGSTVNYSIQHATGKYFKLLDGDDFFDTECLERLLEKLGNIVADVVYTPYLRFDDDSGKTVGVFDISSHYDLNRIYDIRNLMFQQGLEMHALTFRTSVLRENHVNVTEHCFYTDNEFRAKGLAYSSTILFTDLRLYHYRVGRVGQSIDVEGLKKHYKDSIVVAKNLIEFHQHLKIDSNPSVIGCVRNSISYVYRTLILIGLRDEWEQFDIYLKNGDPQYYMSHDAIVRISRMIHPSFFNLFVHFVRLKYKLATKVKRCLYGELI